MLNIGLACVTPEQDKATSGWTIPEQSVGVYVCVCVIRII